MSKIEVVRAAVLVAAAASFLAFDLCFVHLPPHYLGDVYGMLAALQAETALMLGGLVLWPDRRWLRITLGGLVMALVWLALTKMAGEYYLFQHSFLMQLTIGLLMLISFALPCGCWFVLYRKVSGRRLAFLRFRPQADARAQFGMRRLLIFTACFAVVAFAARAVCPDSLRGQFGIGSDVHDYWILSMLCLFPGLVAGPVALAVMRPSWRAILIVPWVMVLVCCEIVVINGAVSGSFQSYLQAVFPTLASYTELAVILVVACTLARVGGLTLSPSEDRDMGCSSPDTW